MSVWDLHSFSSGCVFFAVLCLFVVYLNVFSMFCVGRILVAFQFRFDSRLFIESFHFCWPGTTPDGRGSASGSGSSSG